MGDGREWEGMGRVVWEGGRRGGGGRRGERGGRKRVEREKKEGNRKSSFLSSLPSFSPPPNLTPHTSFTSIPPLSHIVPYPPLVTISLSTTPVSYFHPLITHHIAALATTIDRSYFSSFCETRCFDDRPSRSNCRNFAKFNTRLHIVDLHALTCSSTFLHSQHTQPLINPVPIPVPIPIPIHNRQHSHDSSYSTKVGSLILP